MQSARGKALWTCCALLLALFISGSHAARPSPTQARTSPTPPAPHLKIDPTKDAEVTTVADGSASLLKLVEKACTSMLSKQLNPTETSLAVKNLNLPAKFHLLNSGKGDLPGKIVQFKSTAVFKQADPAKDLGTLTVILDADKDTVQQSGFAQRPHFGYTVNYSVGNQKTVGHVYFPDATTLPAFRSGSPKEGKPTAHGPVTLSTTKGGSTHTLTDTTLPYT
ncbi:hypothetical protein CVIRNUC_000290 [Coccomyxa viridis]|uniref:Uncharacterized protein n=1 Tax=Coccomyxa viridis TaxID=1274662 RepID=A0AAV1HQY7_9CHLO|nr:hypothetical protein CVIRNUC_000290 [Coccomyxa viridis]